MFTVSELVENLNKGVYHNGANKTAKYLDDGNLVYSSELNTKQRAWQLLAIIDREYISHCDEFWIYGSDDYLDSWWTLGELIIYSYLNYRNIDNRGKNTPRKIMFYNPLTNQAHEIAPLKMNENIAERICRIMSNCAPGVMGIDSVMMQRMMRDILYGDKESHDKAMCLFMEKQLTSMIPAMLLSRGLDEKSIRSILSDEDTIKSVTQLMEQAFEDAKEQISKGIIPEELKQISKQMLKVQSDMLGFDVRETVTEEEIITRGWSKEYLEDECFSEDFWETVMYNDTQTSKEVSSSIDDTNTLENQILKIDIKQILDHLSFKCPHHCAIGNISDLENQKINKTPDGKQVRSKSPRFFFMPSRGGMVDLSPTHNNLYKLPILSQNDMTLKEWINKWDFKSLKICTGFLDAELVFNVSDEKAAWEMYVELLTRIATQPLEDNTGNEQVALESIHSLFSITRDIMKDNGRSCIQFSKLAIIVLNQVIRPFTAKWHILSLQNAFDSPVQCQAFRSELKDLQNELRKYTSMLSGIAKVEDLTAM